MARDIRSGWSIYDNGNTSREYAELIVELRRQEKGEFSFKECWEDVMEDSGGTLGGALVASAMLAPRWSAFFDVG